MGKRKRVVRLFFNTFYDDIANKVIDALKSKFGTDKVLAKRSRVLPEFYFVEVNAVDAQSLEEVANNVKRIVEEVGGDKVFGIKVYTVET